MTERTIFLAALDRTTPDERAALLDQACAGDVQLRRQVEALLAEDARAGNFLEQPALVEGSSAIEHLAGIEKPGAMIGPYKLLQQIGEGGMGIVFLAEQTEPVSRKVA